jgi:hypothetical protein
MSAALRTSELPQQPSRRSATSGQTSKVAKFAPPIRSRHSKQHLVPSRSGQSPVVVDRQAVKSLPKPQPAPVWLSLLVIAQRSSSVVTLCLVGAVLAVYSWTVYSQQVWSREYDKLETLQKQERKLMTANEVLKNQMAEQAEKAETGLVFPSPGNTIFLQPAPPRAPIQPSAEPSEVPTSTGPLGY